MAKIKEKTKLLAKFPETEKEYNNLADDLLKWAEQETALEFDEFALKLRIAPNQFAQLSLNNKYFESAYNVAKELIANRLERLGKEGKLDRQFCLAILPLYKDSYKTWLLKLKQKEDESAAKRITVIDYAACNCK